MSIYEIKLRNFQGPLDLLLHLIRRDKIDIFDIPIAYITDEYLKFISQIDKLDLDSAGEFIEMAATLIRIKSKMILPRSAGGDEIEEGDPRDELVQKLLEYQIFKSASEFLALNFERRELIFRRPGIPFKNSNESEPKKRELDTSLYALLEAFKKIIDRLDETEIVYHDISPIEITIEEGMNNILIALRNEKRILFDRLFTRTKERIYIVVTFIALLELIKSRKVIVNQDRIFGEIWISEVEEEQIENTK